MEKRYHLSIRILFKKAHNSLESYFHKIEDSEHAFRMFKDITLKENRFLNGEPSENIYSLNDVSKKLTSSEELKENGRNILEDFLIQYNKI